MKKILCLCTFAAITLTANAQFTVYQSIDPNIPQQKNTQSNSGYPFTIYQSADPKIRQRQGLQQQIGGNSILNQNNLKTVRGVYLNPLTNKAQYIKIKVADNGEKQYAKAHYDAVTNQWFQCNTQITPLGIYDDAELREYFNYKVSIPNIGTIYF